MRKWTRVLLIALLCLILPLMVQAEKIPDARKTIQALYERERAVVIKKDSKNIMASSAPDFVYVSVDGSTVSQSEMISQMTQALSMAMRVKADYKIIKFSQRGNQAQVTVTARMEMLSKHPQTKQVFKTMQEATGEETWQYAKGKWLCKKSQTLKMNVSFERQPNPR